MIRTYLRPTAFVDAPFGYDGRVARLAGGMSWFSAVEVDTLDGNRRVSTELVPVDRVGDTLERLGEAARAAWINLTTARQPLVLGERVVPLDQPRVMGIVNATPDSFSDGGRYDGDPEAAAETGFAMTAAGAAIIDVGGESTRPGAKPVWEGDEIARVLPVVQKLAASGAVAIDPRKASVMEAALGAGAKLVNDVSALTWDEQSAAVIAKAECPVVLMHHQGSPETMQQAPHYEKPVLFSVYDWLEERIAAAVAAGIDRGRMIVDPGIGFGKTVQHNLELMNGLALLHGLGCPILLGASRNGRQLRLQRA